MTKNDDTGLTMMLERPDAYAAYAKGLGGALRSGVPLEAAAEVCGLNADEVAGALGVLRRARRAARGAKRLAKRAGHGLVRVHPLALTAEAAKLTGKGIALATAPVRRRIFRAFFGKLTDRRARLLSWRSRRSLQPSAAEKVQARRWAASYVKKRGIFGKLAAAALSGDVVGEPASAALVTASVPVLIEVARRALKAAESHGAPADPRGDSSTAVEPTESD